MRGKQVHLNQLVERIDEAFGDELPFSDRPLDPMDREVLDRVFGDHGYQQYLQDQINRQIIRDYLTNAMLLGHLPQEALEDLSPDISDPDGRSALSLQMLMSSIEHAPELSSDARERRLKPLKAKPGSPPYIRLVRN
jgi:hypothetical protein